MTPSGHCVDLRALAVGIERQAARGCCRLRGRRHRCHLLNGAASWRDHYEVDSSHVIMVSHPQAVTDVILEAVAAVGSASEH